MPTPSITEMTRNTLHGIAMLPLPQDCLKSCISISLFFKVYQNVIWPSLSLFTCLIIIPLSGCQCKDSSLYVPNSEKMIDRPVMIFLIIGNFHWTPAILCNPLEEKISWYFEWSKAGNNYYARVILYAWYWYIDIHLLYRQPFKYIALHLITVK